MIEKAVKTSGTTWAQIAGVIPAAGRAPCQTPFPGPLLAASARSQAWSSSRPAWPSHGMPSQA